MTGCPDCDSVKLFSPALEGDGRCSACHGTGWDGFLESVAEILGGEESQCDECQGTGRCPTCRGRGVMEEYAETMAA
jgi:DnaJ-class molecular chaperone